MMNHLPLIIKREYLNKVKNKSFIIMTFLTPLIGVAAFALIAFLTNLNKNKERVINVLDESGLIKELFIDSKSSTTYNFIENIDVKSALENVKKGGEYGLLYIPNFTDLKTLASKITFYSKDTPSLKLITSLERKIEKKLTDLQLEKNGLDIAKIKKSRIQLDLLQESFDGKKTSKLGGGLKLIFGGAAGYLLFMFIIIYGNMIMRSIIEEKTSRIIEIIISSVKPMQLMLGKIFGTSLAGVTQFVIWVLVGSLLMTGVSMFLGVDSTEMQSPQQEMMKEAFTNSDFQAKITSVLFEINQMPITNLVIMFVLFFIGGFLLYASLYAAIGAAVDNETDTQQFMMPIMIPLMLAIYVGFFTVMDEPHGIVAQIFSYMPFTSPVVMLMRIPFGVPIWQQIISIIILFASFIGTVWFAAKIYRVGILMYGKKPTYKELYKWLKY